MLIKIVLYILSIKEILLKLFPFIWITIFNSKERSIAFEKNYHTYNFFIKGYYFSCPVMMSLFHLAPPIQPAIFARFFVRESLSTNNTIFAIDRTNSRWSALTTSPSLSLIDRTILCLLGNVSIMQAIGQWFRLESTFRRTRSPFWKFLRTIFVLVMPEWTPSAILPKI